MKLNEGYLLREIEGVPYLLPYGQNIADHRRSMHLNESSLLLLKALEELDISEDASANEWQGIVEQKLLSVLLTYYQEGAPETSQLLIDIRNFLNQLYMMDLLSIPTVENLQPAKYYFRIANLTIGYNGPENLIYPYLFDFSCEEDAPNQTITIIPAVPTFHINGEILIRTNEITICRNKTHYLFLFPADYGVTEMHVTFDGSMVKCFCPNLDAPNLAEDLFHAIRFSFLLKAQMNGLFAMHSASILYKNNAWLFSAPAGTGKSTHVALWDELYQTPILNGDLNLIGFEDDAPIVYGIPWCGTSECYTTNSYPLGGITFLKQAVSDHAYHMTKEIAQHSTAQRLISPTWTKEMLCTNFDFATQLTDKISFYLLECTKEPSAVDAIKQKIDHDTDA